MFHEKICPSRLIELERKPFPTSSPQLMENLHIKILVRFMDHRTSLPQMVLVHQDCQEVQTVFWFVRLIWTFAVRSKINGDSEWHNVYRFMEKSLQKPASWITNLRLWENEKAVFVALLHLVWRFLCGWLNKLIKEQNKFSLFRMRQDFVISEMFFFSWNFWWKVFETNQVVELTYTHLIQTH